MPPPKHPAAAWHVLLPLLATTLGPLSQPTAQAPAGGSDRQSAAGDSTAAIAPDSVPMAERRAHWAWQPLRACSPPADGRHPVDAFVRARLAAAELEPARPAAAHVQLRRLWLDLVGLPPPADAIDRFATARDAAGDERGGAVADAVYEREVDTLLASPHFGERWARHWLDLVRYAETLGHEFDYELPNAWRYRDYVIRACNDDVPYDQFVLEHIAGDLLPEPRTDDEGNNQSVQATAAWWFVEQSHSPVDHLEHRADRIDNQIDVLGKAFLGMTVACARCHDHKFDAITTRDYYGLFGFVQSSRYVQAPLRPVDPQSRGYRSAVERQRDAAVAFARAAFDATGPGPARQPWATFCRTDPARWAPDSGIALRPGDRVIADADDDANRARGARTGWFVTNDGFGSAPFRGPFCPDPESNRPELRLLPGAFWLSCCAGTAREGTIATETFRLDDRYVHVRVAGVGSRVKLIVDGFLLVRDPIYGGLHRRVDDPDAHWLTFDVGDWHGREAWLMAIDQRDPDLADPQHDRGHYPDDAWLAVQTVVASPHAAPPKSPLPTAVFHFQPAPDDVGRAALRELAAAQKALPVSPTVPALADGSGRDSAVYLRGDPHRLAEPAPRRFLSALADDERPVETRSSSGRLQLAKSLLADDNPLPARVLVNRIWHHLFGRGLVASVDNFGALGQRPSHPELLDWLARDFVAHGWSIKHTIRRIVTSAAYRRSSRREAVAGAVERDPDNVLLHRQNVRPLEAELVRDGLLAISGRLDPKLFGPSIQPPADSITEARGKPKRHAPRDGNGRRSIYLAVRRNFMPPMLVAFDLPAPFATVGARNRSNVPAQALALANDPFVHEQCARFADRVRAHADDPATRLVHAYRLAFAREPRADERRRCLEFLAEHDGDERAAWTDLVHALCNTTEFRFRR